MCEEITRGRIQWECFAMCGVCGETEDCITSGYQDDTPAKELREIGWRNTRGRGWVCPGCLKGYDKELKKNRKQKNG